MCSPGTSIGAFIVDNPNRTTVGIVGMEIPVKWSFTPMVKNKPQFVDIMLQSIQDQSIRTFPIEIARNTSCPDQIYNWLIQPLNDGQYQLRVGIASRDPLLNKDACLQNGEANGASSPVFKIANAKSAPPKFPDRFGPVNSASIRITTFEFSLVNLAMLFL